MYSVKPRKLSLLAILVAQVVLCNHDVPKIVHKFLILFVRYLLSSCSFMIILFIVITLFQGLCSPVKVTPSRQIIDLINSSIP